MPVKKTVRHESAAAFVDAASGEYLEYTVSFQGAGATFALVDSETKVLLLSHKAKPAALDGSSYSRRWPLPADTVIPVTDHALGLQFLVAVTYTYRCDLKNSTGALIRTILDMDFQGSAADDWYFQGLGITLHR